MEATYRDYGREAMHNLIFGNPEIYELFKPDLDGKFNEGLLEGERKGERKGKREGKLETARNLMRMGFSHDVIFQATGLKPEEYS